MTCDLLSRNILRPARADDAGYRSIDAEDAVLCSCGLFCLLISPGALGPHCNSQPSQMMPATGAVHVPEEPDDGGGGAAAVGPPAPAQERAGPARHSARVKLAMFRPRTAAWPYEGALLPSRLVSDPAAERSSRRWVDALLVCAVQKFLASASKLHGARCCCNLRL